MRDALRRINYFKVRLFSVNAGQGITLALNSNLFPYGDKGVLIGTVSLNKGWNLIELPLNGMGISPGLNKLSFWFNGGGENRESLGVAFDKAYFGYSEKFSRKWSER